MSVPTPNADRMKALTVALWKLIGREPLQVMLADMRACSQAFDPDGYKLLILDIPGGVEFRVTTRLDALMQRLSADSRGFRK
jgi:hypothetical protein